MIRSGSVAEVHRSSGEWAFVDIGFAREAKTAALLLHDGEPDVFTFSQLRQRLVSLTAQAGSPLNLVIEAPLSAAFTAEGNPTGRRMEKNDAGRHRYWYAGLGCQVTLAAAYILRAMLDARPKREVRIFEAFVSFKPKDRRSTHSADVRAMRAVVWKEAGAIGEVLAPESLLTPLAKRIQSSFVVFGFDLSVPPVIVASAP